MEEKTKVIDKSDLRKYRIELPNLIDDLGLSVYAFRLYAHIKRVAGESGYCNQGLRQMASHCGMSLGAASSARKELIEAELIDITEGSVGLREVIVIADLWERNFKNYFKDKSPVGVHQVNTGVHTVNGCSPPERGVHQVNTGVHTVNTPIKEEEITYEERTNEEGAHAKNRVSQPTAVDDSFLKQLGRNPAYDGISVENVYHKMVAWCQVNSKVPTRRRLVNWLNREDRPIKATSKQQRNFVPCG